MLYRFTKVVYGGCIMSFAGHYKEWRISLLADRFGCEPRMIRRWSLFFFFFLLTHGNCVFSRKGAADGLSLLQREHAAETRMRSL